MPEQDTILLQTKLHRPRLPKDLLPRVRLIEQLNRDLDRQLVLVCGPAGFGKTTLIGTWLDRLATVQNDAAATPRSAWLSLDERDSDLTLFLRYAIAALRTAFEDCCEHTLSLLQARQQPPPALLYATFGNELEHLPGDVVLVLDDFHTIHSTQVHGLLDEFVRHWPRPLHLVLISRVNPPIPLDRLRAMGMLCEIRTRDLRFQPDETAAYLSQPGIAPLTREALPLLEKRFEGWPAGVRLAALSVRSEGNPEGLLAALSSENPNITGFLMDEVLSHQLPAVYTFLLRTSILDRFCASLGEAVLGEVDSAWDAQACVDWLERSELFVTPLDHQHLWYRYHALFQELLQQRLSSEMTPDQIGDLHRRASLWFEGHQLADEALQHALAAGDLDLAARQMGEALREVINREDRPTLERWLRLLPDDLIQRRPELLMVRAWVLEFSWRLDLQTKVVDQVEALLDSPVGVSLSEGDVRILRGQVLTLRAQQAYFSNQSARAIELCQQALALLPASWSFARGGAMMYLGMAMQASGQSAAAERLLLEEYEACADRTGTYASLVLRALGFNHLGAGELEPTRRVARVLLDGATHTGVAIMLSWAHWFLGLVCFERNELEAAALHFQQIVDNRYVSQLHGIPGRSRRPGPDPSRPRGSSAGVADRGFGQPVRPGATRQRGRSNTFAACPAPPAARRHRRSPSLGGVPSRPANGPASPRLEEPQVTRVRCLLATGRETDVQKALEVLAVLDDIAERTHNNRYKIRILALRSLALDAQGKVSEADAALKLAVDRARPGGFLRVFLDLGRPMQEMLRRRAKQEILGAGDSRYPGGVRPGATSSRRRPARASRASPGFTIGRAPDHPGARGPEPVARAAERQRNRSPAPHLAGHGQAPHCQHLRQARRQAALAGRGESRRTPHPPALAESPLSLP